MVHINPHVRIDESQNYFRPQKYYIYLESHYYKNIFDVSYLMELK